MKKLKKAKISAKTTEDVRKAIERDAIKNDWTISHTIDKRLKEYYGV